MATKTSDGDLIALLHTVRAGAVHSYVHLVANLEPAPGTDGVWYFYCAKKYKNTLGKTTGHRQRAIAGGDMCWHAERSPKEVEGWLGRTFCLLSYGRKKQGSGRSFDRLGWCMVEYDDSKFGRDDYVLCKVYRSSRAPSSSSSSSRSTSSKRKAAGDHPETQPAKMIHEEMQQVTTPFTDEYQMSYCNNSMIGNDDVNEVGVVEYQMPYNNPYIFGSDQEQQHLQQPGAEPTEGSQFMETEYGLLLYAVAQMNAEDWIHGGDEEQRVPERQGGDFIQGRCGGPTAPVIDEATIMDGMLGLETMSGEGLGMPAAFTPPEADFFDGVDQEYPFRFQEMQQQQPPPPPPSYEPDRRAKYFESLTRLTHLRNSPSTSCSVQSPRQASDAGQQGNHWMQPTSSSSFIF